MKDNTKKILIIFGTRPELIKLATLIKELYFLGLRKSLLVVNTNQHDELIDGQLNFWNIDVDINFKLNKVKNQLSRIFTQTLDQLQFVLDDYPELQYLVVQGDTNTALACSHASFFNKKKLIHIEAGLRTFHLDNPYPEEFNRVVTSIVAHHHFTPTRQNTENLLKQGIDMANISEVGNTIVDAINYTNGKIERSDKKEKDKVIITIHRRENSDSCYLDLLQTIKSLKKNLSDLTFVWVCHPSNEKKIMELARNFPEIEVSGHLSHLEFFKLYHSSRMIITDSGGVSEEGVQLGIPVVVYRDYTERIEPVDTGYPYLVSKNRNEIIKFAQLNVSKSHIPGNYYNGGNASKNIAKWLKMKFP